MANTDETPVFSHMLTNTAVDAKWSIPVLIKTMGHDKIENCHGAFSILGQPVGPILKVEVPSLAA